jgi:hypothetical protein
MSEKTMQAITSKPSLIALAIALSVAGTSADARPARKVVVPDFAPLNVSSVLSHGTSGSIGVARPLASLSRDALEPTIILPRLAPDLPRAAPDLPRAAPDLPRAAPDLPRAAPDLPRASPMLRLSDPKLTEQLTTPAPRARVAVELAPNGTGVLRYSDHGVGIPILLAGVRADKHAAINFAAVAHDLRRSIPQTLRIDPEYGVVAELLDGSRVEYSEAEIQDLMQPLQTLKMTPQKYRVAAR